MNQSRKEKNKNKTISSGKEVNLFSSFCFVNEQHTPRNLKKEEIIKKKEIKRSIICTHVIKK